MNDFNNYNIIKPKNITELKVRKTSLLGFMTDIEAKVLSLNILRFINYLTHSNNKAQIASLIFGY